MKASDYIAITKAIKTHTVTTPDGEYIAVRSFVDSLCDILKADNPNFNKEKFLELLK